MPENSIGPSPDEIAKNPLSHPAKRLNTGMLRPEERAILDKLYPDQPGQGGSTEKPPQSPPSTNPPLIEQTKPIVVSHPAKRVSLDILGPEAAGILDQIYPDQQQPGEIVKQTPPSPTSQPALGPSKPPATPKAK